jgi:hypothetical protein
MPGGRKPRGPFKDNSAVISIRIPQDMKADIEALAADNQRSMNQEVLFAISRWIGRHKNPGTNEIGDAVALLASEIERRTGKRIADDADASAVFTVAVPDVIKRYAATGGETTDAITKAALISAETVLALLDRGLDLESAWKESADWSGIRTTSFKKTFVTRGRK